MAADPSFTSKSFTQIPPSDFANSGTGTTSAVDMVYAWTSVDGYYEIRNNAENSVSSPMSSPNFPTFSNPTEVILTLQATVGANVVNVSPADASANAGHWSYSPSNSQGGLAISGSLYTLSAGEVFLPVTNVANSVGTQQLPNGLLIEAPFVYTTGYQNYAIMPQPGPWPAGIGANTSATINGAMMSVWADLGSILNTQGANGLESLTNNWSPSPD